MLSSLPQRAKKAPQAPGVYFFEGRGGRILYIGKATNLRSRLQSYFRSGATLEPAKQRMLNEAAKITWQTTESEPEALILEAQLIKKHRTYYNVLFRDDKQYFYVGFTKEDFPRVFLTHQPTRDSRFKIQDSEFVGPFTEGKAIKLVMKFLRRIFPYATHQGIPKHCFSHDLGLCPIPKQQGPWMQNKTFIRTYRKNIRNMQAVLKGKRTWLIAKLQKEMGAAAKNQNFEEAAKIRDQIMGLEKIFEHRSVLSYNAIKHEAEKSVAASAIRKEMPASLRKILPKKNPRRWRLEGYDISNIQGTSATGSLVTFIGSEPDKSGYKKFRIKTVRGANDIAMLKEVLERRLEHPEWSMPDIMLIDGGKAQLNAAIKALNAINALGAKKNKAPKAFTASIAPAVLALAKKREELYIPDKKHPIRLPKNHPLRLLFMHVRDEAHRFARAYYLKRHKRTLLSE